MASSGTEVDSLIQFLDRFPTPPENSPRKISPLSSPEFTRRNIALPSLFSSSSNNTTPSPPLMRKKATTTSTPISSGNLFFGATPSKISPHSQGSSPALSPTIGLRIKKHIFVDDNNSDPSSIHSSPAPRNRAMSTVTPRSQTLRTSSKTSNNNNTTIITPLTSLKMDLEFFKKASLSSYNMSQKEQAQLHENLLKATDEQMSKLSEKATTLLTERRKTGKFGSFLASLKKSNDDFPQCRIDKTYLKFGSEEEPLAVNVGKTHEITIYNESNTTANFFLWKGAPNQKFSLEFDPQEGSIKKKCSQIVKIIVTIRSTMVFSHLISLEIENGQRFFVILTGASEKSVFGVSPETIPSKNHMGLEKIPIVLITLADYLLKNKGEEALGIFRISGSDTDFHKAKDELNRGVFEKVDDIHVVASLIKVWFRELPFPLLNHLPPDKILEKSEDPLSCAELFSELPKNSQHLLKWLIKLLCKVATKENENKMSLRNLAIVVAPNLWSGEFETQLDPMDFLVVSQRIVTFFLNLCEVQFNSTSFKDLLNENEEE